MNSPSKTILLTFSGVIWLNLVFAQQLPIYTFHRDHWGMANPAGVSSNYITQDLQMSISATIRQQWLALKEDAPKTQIISFEYINDKDVNGYSIGAHLMNDRTGAFGQTGAYGSFAYRLHLGDRNSNTVLAGGLSLGGVYYRADLFKIFRGDDGINSLSFEDLQTLSNSKKFLFDTGLGLMLYLGGRNDAQNYYAGVSVPQTFGFNMVLGNDNKSISIKRQQHYYATLGGYFFKSRRSHDSFLEVNIWGRYLPNAPISVDANVRYQHQNRVWLGIGGGMSGQVRAELGTLISNVNSFKIGVAYNQYISKYKTAFGQTLEASVSYSIETR